MKDRYKGNQGTGTTLYAFIALFVAGCFGPAYAAYTPPSTNRAGIDFNLNWKYRQGEVNGASAKSFGS